MKKEEGSDYKEVHLPIDIIHLVEECAILNSSIEDNLVNGDLTILFGAMILIDVLLPCLQAMVAFINIEHLRCQVSKVLVYS